MKYHYAVMYGEKGKPHAPAYFRFQTALARNFFVWEPGRSGVELQPGDAFFREAVPWSRFLSNLRWRARPQLGYEESLG